MSEFVNHPRPNGHLYFLDSIKDQEAKLSVKHIHIIDLFPSRSVTKFINDMATYIFLKGKHVGAETKVTHICQLIFSLSFIGKCQTSTLQEFYLIVIC